MVNNNVIDANDRFVMNRQQPGTFHRYMELETGPRTIYHVPLVGDVLECEPIWTTGAVQRYASPNGSAMENISEIYLGCYFIVTRVTGSQLNIRKLIFVQQLNKNGSYNPATAVWNFCMGDAAFDLSSLKMIGQMLNISQLRIRK